MDDNRIIELYFERSENAIAETQKKYGKYCFYIAQNILECELDAEEIVNDTYLRAWDSIPPTRPKHFKIYLGRIAKRLALNRRQYNTRDKRGGAHVDAVIDEFADFLTDGDGDPTDAIALRDSLNRFLASLDEQTRNIFVRRYWYSAQVSDIARDFRMGESRVCMLMLRTRKKLELFLQKEGFEL